MLKINELARLYLGVKQENESRTIQIDMSAWAEIYPNATAEILHKRWGDELKELTGATYDSDTKILSWTPTSYDTFYDGFGVAEIRMVEGDVVKKTKDLISTAVSPSITGGSGEIIESDFQAWLNTVIGYKNDAVTAKNAAKGYKEDSEAYAVGKRNGTDVESTDPAYENNAKYFAALAAALISVADVAGAEAITLAAGSSATVEIQTTENGKKFVFGIPKGANGSNGEPGADGYSPTVSVSKSGSVTTLTVTDKNGTTTVQISDGEDGTSPTARVSKSGSVTTLTVTDKSGTTTAQINDGTNGTDGTDGVSPVLTIGTVTTGSAGSSASATIDNTDPANPVLNMTIPKGAKGDTGNTGATGAAATDAQVAAYLSSVISNPSSPPLDRTLGSNVSAAPADMAGAIKGVVQDILTGGNVLDYSSCVSGRLRVSDGAVVSATNQHYSDYIPVWPGMIVRRNFHVSSDSYGDVYYNASKGIIETVKSNTDTKMHEAPAGAMWVRLTIPNSALVSGSETAVVIVEPKVKMIAEKTNWLAIGDSITFGVYSAVENGNTVKMVGDGWVRKLASALNYNIKVMASRGMGYTAAVTGKDPDDPDGPRISLDTLLTRIEALTDDYNLITIAFGVNDYNTPSSASLATVALGLNDALQRITTKWKSARVVVITPFNCCNQANGTAATKWDCNYEVGSPGRSLADIAHKIRDCCDAYGVECINATENFLFNITNIAPSLSDSDRLLPDKVHPSLYAHTLIAKAMAHYLMN